MLISFVVLLSSFSMAVGMYKARVDKMAGALKTAETTADYSGSDYDMVYNGGKLLGAPNLVPVYLGKQRDVTRFDNFYAAYAKSSIPVVLNSLYATGSYTFHQGTANKGKFIGSKTVPATVNMQWIQKNLNEAFNKKTLPKPNGNNVYIVHFPAGTKVDYNGGSFWVDPSTGEHGGYWCGVHGSYLLNGVYVYYSLIVDYHITWPYCGGTENGYTAFSAVSSHELMEIQTDPDVNNGLLGWYNNIAGENCDGCGTSVTGILGDGSSYNLNGVWSNVEHACVNPTNNARVN